MKITLIISLLLFLNANAYYLWNKDFLNYSKDNKEFFLYKEAYLNLIEKANRFLNEPSVSVIDKDYIPISGDKHDYVSLSRYYWPDSTKKNGIPYISRDGYTNPEIENYDRNRLEKMSVRVRTLSLAYYFSDEKKFAIAAVEQIKKWFIDADTKMNPHLEFAQMIPGRNNSRGFSFGVLDGYSFVEMMDSFDVLKKTKFWDIQYDKQIKEWFQNYFIWLITSKQGIAESNASNNHGTTYDTQLLAYSLFLGKKDFADSILKNFSQKHLDKQIDLDGKQVNEIKRSRSFHYSWYNLSHILDFFIIAKNNNMNIYPYFKKMECAYSFLYPYVEEKKLPWPYKEVSNMEQTRFRLIEDMYRFYLYINKNKENFKSVFFQNISKFKNSSFILVNPISN